VIAGSGADRSHHCGWLLVRRRPQRGIGRGRLAPVTGGGDETRPKYAGVTWISEA